MKQNLTDFLTIALFSSLIAVCVAGQSIAGPEVAQRTFNIYADKKSPDNHYTSSGWMGDYGDIRLNDVHTESPHSGETCIEIVYTAEQRQGAGWAGIFWQNPPNNWGAKDGGLDLTGYNKLSFWARGKEGGEIVEKFQVGGIRGNYSDSCEVSIGTIALSKEWQEYTINLADQNLSYIIGGFCWVTSARLASGGITFYLDDIKFEK